MRNTRTLLFAALLAFGLTGCYHTTVVTGLPYGADSQVIEKPWHMTYVAGLVPGPDVDVSTQCTQGVAKVETLHSFLNGLVGSLSGGLITPLTVMVTCANGPRQ